MLFAALETSSLRGSLALFRGEAFLRQVVFPEGLVHGREVALGLRELLDLEGVRPADLDALAVGIGPGSYTGTRVGVTAAKTLGFALRIPVLPCSSLEALALPLLERAGEARPRGNRRGAGASSDGGASCLPVLDARQGLFYFALFSCRPSGGRIVRESADRVGPVTEIEGAVTDRSVGRAAVLVPGDGADRLLELLGDKLPEDRGTGRAFVRAPRDLDLPDARSLGRIAASRLGGARFNAEDVHRLEPAYLRPSEPEILAARCAPREATGS